MVTAVLGMLVFGELLPTMWWIGAGFLCAGSVVIGMREEKSTASVQLGEDSGQASDAGAATSMALGTGEAGGYRDRASIDSESHSLVSALEDYKEVDEDENKVT